MYVLHWYELLESEGDSAGLTVVYVEAFPITTPVAITVWTVALADLHPALRAPAVVAEEVAETVTKTRPRC